MRLDPPLDASPFQGAVLVWLALPSGNSQHLPGGVPGPTSLTESLEARVGPSQLQVLWEVACGTLRQSQLSADTGRPSRSATH